MLFLDFSHEQIESFKSKYNDVAGVYKGKGLNFLIGDVKASQAALQVNYIYFFHFSSFSLNLTDV